MNRYLDFGLAVVTNFIGYWSVAICFYTLLKLNIVGENFFVEQSTINFRDWSAGVLIVWIICLLFSIAGLFVSKKERYILIAAPAFVPAFYGFSVLVLFGGLSF